MLFAVHIDDGILNLPWIVAGFAGMSLLYWFGARRIRDEEIPRIALLTAVFFISSTIHVPVPKTSVHLVSNALLGVLLGWRAAVAIPVGLLLQAMLLQHGGFYSLGINSCVMTLPALAAGVLFHSLQRLPWISRPWCRALLVGISSIVGILSLVYGIAMMVTNLATLDVDLDLEWANHLTFHPLTLAGTLALSLVFVWAERHMENAPEFPLGLLVGELTVLATAALNCLAMLFGGDDIGFSRWALVLLVGHLPIAVVEGVILGITVGFLRRVKPEMLGLKETAPADLQSPTSPFRDVPGLG